MIRFIFPLLITIYVHPIFAQNQEIQTKTTKSLNSNQLTYIKYDLKTNNKVIFGYHSKYNKGNFSSKLALNHSSQYGFNIDGSFIQNTSGIITYGFGAINRHWSFSEKTSLILSNNARPVKSVYLKLQDRFGYNWLPTEANWDFEIFNGYTQGSLNKKKSMLLGVRAVISPLDGLDFEITQTSQWGGKGYSTGVSALNAALLLDSNHKENANINKMSGFGLSYLSHNSLVPFRIYGQVIGEDEAGSLPTCLAYLAGIEWSNKKVRYPTTLGIETVNTKTRHSDRGFCGPNSIYNNSIYNYTNYGKVLGAAIDTQGNSFEFFGKSQISQEMNLEFSTKVEFINENNWPGHRLSSNYQSGVVNSLGISWAKNNFKFNGSIFYKDFVLDKAKINDGFGLGLFSSVEF